MEVALTNKRKKAPKQSYQTYYQAKGWRPFDFQMASAKAIEQERNGLLNVPTGFGKTNALMVPIALDGVKKYHRSTKFFAIWITPLRALSQDIYDAAVDVSRHYGLNWRIGIRNGDTSLSERQKQTRSAPQILITTPESLHLLLAQKNYADQFRTLEYFIVDEWHELLGSKRGVQVELALSRLKTISPNLKIWGISATIGNLDQAEQVLFGDSSHYHNKVRISTSRKKNLQIKTILPDEVEKYPWAGHLGIKMAPKVLPIINDHQSVLIFTNTRSQAEIWYQQLLELAPHLAGLIALHHGSLSREQRLWVEDALHQGKLKAVVCTSSLDLGVDFSPVDVVIQVGGPKGIARFIQRGGRSGHSPGQKSKIYFLPTHSLELLESSALQEAVLNDRVEDREPYVRSFDVLAQYLVTLAVSDGFVPHQIKEEVLSTHCFQSMSHEEWNWLLAYITRGGEALEAYDEFKRVEVINGLYKVESKRIAMRHRLSIGTIVSDNTLNVKYLRGSFIGTIEEWFISKITPGETFWFAGRNLELVKIKENSVLVKKSNRKKSGKVPAWMGGRMPLSTKLGSGLRTELGKVAREDLVNRELKTLVPLMERQREISVVPEADQLLMESFQTREGYHLCVYPFEGRFVHEGIGALFAYRISLLQPITFSIAVSDYGFELLSDQPIPVQEAIDNEFFTPERLWEDLEKSLNASEMARRQFRDIASIAGMVFQGYPGKQIKEKHLQASSQLFFNVFQQYDRSNLFLRQAFDEAYHHQLEIGRLQLTLERISQMGIVWMQPDKPTPFAFPIMIDRLRSKLSSEKLEDRIRRMQVQYAK